MELKTYEDYIDMIKDTWPAILRLSLSDAFDYISLVYEKNNKDVPQNIQDMMSSSMEVVEELNINADEIPFEEFTRLRWILARYSND